MKIGFAYARVSTKDQDQLGNSIPEQLLRIENFASQHKITISQIYQDTSSAYHDENREQFNQMITDAIKERPDFILVDDSSRFARTREVSAVTKKLLRKHGIEFLLANEDNINPMTTAGLWLEGIRDIKNEAYSMEISYNTVRGMSGNIKNRDPETGWCYKNGGRAPYGYQIKRLNKGTNSKGKPILKSVWELHSEHSEIVHQIIVELYTNKVMSYDKIRDYLNSNNITGPQGKPWGTSTIVEMLRENRLQQYAGTAFWNKENRKVIGARFNPREKWIEQSNAHPAIISEEELNMALQRKAFGRNNYNVSRTIESPFLFTGKNIDNEPLFTCTACNGNIIGYRSSSKHWRKYVCGQHRYKGEAGCKYNIKLDQEWLENTILEEVVNRYTVPDSIDLIIDEIKQNIQAGHAEYMSSINNLTKDKKELKTKLDRLLEAVKNGFDASVIADEANTLSDQIKGLDRRISYMIENPPSSLKVDENEIRYFFSNFENTFNQATIEEKKNLIKSFVRKMELDPIKREVRATFFPDIVHSFGVGRG